MQVVPATLVCRTAAAVSTGNQMEATRCAPRGRKTTRHHTYAPTRTAHTDRAFRAQTNCERRHLSSTLSTARLPTRRAPEEARPDPQDVTHHLRLLPTNTCGLQGCQTETTEEEEEEAYAAGPQAQLLALDPIPPRATGP